MSSEVVYLQFETKHNEKEKLPFCAKHMHFTEYEIELNKSGTCFTTHNQHETEDVF